MQSEPRHATSAGDPGSPSIIATYHLSDDQATRELTGSLAPQARFPIASVAKTLAAILVARLCTDGAVNWDEPITDDNTMEPVTLRTLLSHTARVPFELRPAHWGPAALTQTELTTAMLQPSRLGLPPGTSHYSNLGYAMAARRLEDITGTDYATLLSTHVLEPLGMDMTSFPDNTTEGPCLLGAAAAAGDLWSSLDDLMTLARALGGHRPDVVTWRMLSQLLAPAVPDSTGACLAAGIRTHRVRRHRVLVSTGTIGELTTCVLAWPRRGYSVLVAERGYSHEALWQTAAARWDESEPQVRTWWWDGQEVTELRHGRMVELIMNETTWPFAVFSGEVRDGRLRGVDWRGDQLELLDEGDVLAGTHLRLTSDAADSAHAEPGHE